MDAPERERGKSDLALYRVHPQVDDTETTLKYVEQWVGCAMVLSAAPGGVRPGVARERVAADRELIFEDRKVYV